MGEDELRQEIERLRQRIERLEKHLRLEEAEAPVPAAPPTTPPPPPPPPPDTTPAGAGYPVTPREEPAPIRHVPPAWQPSPRPEGQPPVLGKSARWPAPKPKKPPKPSSPLEMLIGGKLAAWIGALVIVIAVALLMKLGYDEGWWGRVPVTLRCLAIAGFGGLLLAAGEVALRRVSRAASVGLFGAGLGVLYLDAFATFQFFQHADGTPLVGQVGAFILMGVVAFGGFAITLRTKFKTIGVLALIGGYATPVLLRGGGGHDLEVLTFITVLFGTALALSAAQPRQFRTLRYVALGGQGAIGLLWLLASGGTNWMMGLVFFGVWWAMLLAETVFAGLRRQSALGNPVAMLLGTSAYVSAGAWILHAWAPVGADWLGLFTVAIAVLGAAVALQFGPGVDGLRGPPRDAMAKLAVALWAQSGVLLIVAVAFQFDGFAQAASWLAITVAAVEMGRRLPSRGLDVFGLVLVFLTGGYVVILYGAMVGGLAGTMDDVFVSGAGITITRWAVVALIWVLAMHVVAQRLRTSGPNAWRRLPVVITAFAMLGWLCVGAIQGTGLAASWWWLVGGAILIGLEPFGRRQRYLEIGMLTVLATAGRWLLIDTVEPRARPGWDAFAMVPWLNGQMAMVLAIAAVAWWGMRVTAIRAKAREIESGRPTPGAQAAVQAILVGVVVFLLLGMSFEVDRLLARVPLDGLGHLVFRSGQVLALWLTALWAAGGVVLVVLGRAQRMLQVLRSGQFILFCAALVWLSYDTLGFRVGGTTLAMVVINVQFAVGGLIAALFAVSMYAARDQKSVFPEIADQPPTDRIASLALLAALGLWLGSLEIDRAAAHGHLALQSGLSVYWALYGVMLVVVGFIRPVAAVRYAGLALLTITVGKVLFVDLATVDKIWRVASFLVSGLLLVGTSVLYTKFSPRIVQAVRSERE